MRLCRTYLGAGSGLNVGRVRHGYEAAAGAAEIFRGRRDHHERHGSIVHDEEYGRRRVTVGLQGYDIPVTVWDEYVDLVGKREPVKAGRRKQPLFDEAD